MYNRSSNDCTAAHQRASVTVSGRFWSANSSGGGRVYFGGSDVRVDLTDHVIGRLAVRDVTVASIHGNVLAAVGAGLTQVEVSSVEGLLWYVYVSLLLLVNSGHVTECPRL